MPNQDIFESKTMFTGETARKGITITKNSGTLDVTSATYAVYNEETGAVVTAESDAEIDGADVYQYISAGTSTGKFYVLFKFIDGSATRKAKLTFEVV